MLTLKRLEIQDFGPFIGSHAIDFPSEGVTVIHGRNGDGKTNVLNAIRYALYGQVLNRASAPRAYRTIANRERAKTGDFDFQVTLHFDFDGDDFELTRACAPRKGVTKPKTDRDFEQKVILRVGGEVKGPEERDALLNRVMPFEVARFFLFDGELLKEYEDLLIADSDIGEQIAGQIERILGVPFLKQGRTHLRMLHEAALKDVAREAKKNRETEAAAGHLQTATETRTRRQQDLEKLKRELAEFERDKETQEKFLSSQERNAVLLEQRTDLLSAIESAKQDEDGALNDLRAALETSWRGLVSGSVVQALDRAEAESQEAIDRFTTALRTESLESGECVVCEHDLSEADRERIVSKIPSGESADPTAVATTAYAALQSVKTLAKFQDADKSQEVASAWGRVEKARLAAAKSREQIEQIEEEVDASSAEPISASKRTLTGLTKKIAYHEEKIADAEKSIEKLDSQIAKYSRDIDEASAGEYSSVRSRAELLESAREVFENAIGGYRDELRERVATDATRFFRKMISDPEFYEGLEINDSYGLFIVFADGTREEARSAGQEHIVALALVAALQKNAPIGGPIVMDSPFGRLDEFNTANVVETLPAMSKQAVLLVYAGEIDDEAMRATLGPELKAEYSISKVSAHESKITRGV